VVFGRDIDMSLNFDSIPLEGRFVEFYNNVLVKAIEAYLERDARWYSYSFTPVIRSFTQIPFLSFRCKSEGAYNAIRFDFIYEINDNSLSVEAGLIKYTEDGSAVGKLKLLSSYLESFNPGEIDNLVDKGLQEFNVELV
jgi:hypothetical protein